MEMMKVNSSDVTLSGMGEDIGSGSGSGSSSGSGINNNFFALLVSGLDPFINYTFYVLATTIAASEPSNDVTVITRDIGKGVHYVL